MSLYRLVSIPKCRFRILTLLCLFAKQKGIRVDAFGIHPGREEIILNYVILNLRNDNNGFTNFQLIRYSEKLKAGLYVDMRCRSLARAFSTPPVVRACSIRQAYMRRVQEVEQGSFTPLVFSTSGGFAVERKDTFQFAKINTCCASGHQVDMRCRSLVRAFSTPPFIRTCSICQGTKRRVVPVSVEDLDFRDK
eukprot:sb/3471009/